MPLMQYMPVIRLFLKYFGHFCYLVLEYMSNWERLMVKLQDEMICSQADLPSCETKENFLFY